MLITTSTDKDIHNKPSGLGDHLAAYRDKNQTVMNRSKAELPLYHMQCLDEPENSIT